MSVIINKQNFKFWISEYKTFSNYCVFNGSITLILGLSNDGACRLTNVPGGL